MAQRIGLYGGTFDPVHIGHLLVAQAALEELKLDRIVFIPAGRSPFKPDNETTPGPLRAKMLRVALAGWNRAVVDTSELDRDGVSFSIDTIRQYKTLHPNAELFYLIGTDHVATLPKWRDAGELAAAVSFHVVPRPGEVQVPFPEPFRGAYLTGHPVDIASSTIRERANLGQSIDHMVPPGVAEIVKHNRLYL